MVSMLLFGELYRLMGEESGWYRVSAEFDGYHGWISGSMVHWISEEEFISLQAENRTLCEPVYIVSDAYPGYPFMILPGSSLPSLSSRMDFVLGGNKFTLREPFRQEERITDPLIQIRKTAMLFLNAPYIWGGRSLFGVDCSGFVQVVFKTAGIRLPRDAGQQVHAGKSIAFSEAAPGDIAFFGPSAGSITHVGILLEPAKLIHASGKVKIEDLDEKGIFSKEKKQITHFLQEIRRVTGTD